MGAAPELVETPHFCELHIDRIIVQDRHRADLGDISALAESIVSIGLIHNVVVTPDNHLIAGERRLAAMRSLGWDMIPVTVIHTLADATDRLLAERDENTCRKDFTASELLAIGRRLEELERPKAQERQRESGGDRRSEAYRSSSVDEDRSTGSAAPTNRIVGEALGVSQSTYERLKVVDNATRDGDPAVADIAKKQIARLDAGTTTPFAAAAAIRNARAASAAPTQVEDPAVKPGLPSKVHGPRPNHLKILSRVAVNLSGMVMALDDIGELNDTVNTEEALRISKDLSISIRALNRINNLLKERTK